MPNMEQLCRVCMDSSVTLVDIFAERQQQSNSDPSLAEMLNEFCEVKANDLLPQHICLSCVLAAQNAYKFKRTCEESNRKLLELLAKKNKDTQCMLPFVEAVYQNELIPVNLSSVKIEPLHPEETNVIEEILPHAPENSQVRLILQKVPRQRSEQSQNDRPHKCKFCGKGFTRLYLLNLHEKRHTGEKTFFCKTCGKGFIRSHDLTVHNRIHSGERPFKCPECQRTFIQNHVLKAHMIHHHQDIHCELCPAAFQKKVQLRRHLLVIHGQAKKSTTKSPINNRSAPKEQTSCSNMCQKPPETQSTGMERELRNRLPTVSYEELDIECELNEIDVAVKVERLSDIPDLNGNRHGSSELTVHTKKQKDHKNTKSSRSNKGKYSSEIKNHFCDICGKGFPRRYALTQHERVHTGERPYKCNFCQFAFTQGQALKRHMRRLHSNVSNKELRLGANQILMPPVKRLVVRLPRLHLPPRFLSFKSVDS